MPGDTNARPDEFDPRSARSAPYRCACWIRRLLASLMLFGFVSALIGMGLALVGGAGFPVQYLERTPFGSTVLPGLILGLVVGGTQGAAAGAVLRSRRHALLLGAIAGFAMVIWIFTELAMLMQYSVLQTAYLGLGVAELTMVMALLGIEPRLVARWEPGSVHGLGAQDLRPAEG